ncbi:MAG: DUF429 domain-containing protein [Thermoplasmata archaeon]
MLHVGLDLGGRKGSKTALCVLVDEENIAIGDVMILPKEGDEFIVDYLSGLDDLSTLSIDSPFQFPVCIRCEYDACPGVDACENEVVSNIREKSGNPYTQRLTEIILREKGMRPIETSALGQIVSRTIYLLKRLRKEGVSCSILEVYPRASLLSIAQSKRFGSRKFEESCAKYKSPVSRVSHRSRQNILKRLSEAVSLSLFSEKLVENDDMFDSFLAAYTGCLFSRGLTIPMPPDHPSEDGWIVLPDPKKL